VTADQGNRFHGEQVSEKRQPYQLTGSGLRLMCTSGRPPASAACCPGCRRRLPPPPPARRLSAVLPPSPAPPPPLPVDARALLVVGRRGLLERHAQRRCKPCCCKMQNSRNQVLTRFGPSTPGRDTKVTPNESASPTSHQATHATSSRFGDR